MEAKNNIQQTMFFPKLKAGYKKPIQFDVHALAAFAFKLAIDVRAFLEDIDGSPQHPHYLKTLKFRLLEMLYELNMIISYASPMEEIHYASLALEYGINEIAVLNGNTLIDIFALFDDFNSEEVDISGVKTLFNHIIEAFPGEIPDPLVTTGQSAMLKALRNWDKICSMAGIDAKFVQDLLKEV